MPNSDGRTSRRSMFENERYVFGIDNRGLNTIYRNDSIAIYCESGYYRGVQVKDLDDPGGDIRRETGHENKKEK